MSNFNYNPSKQSGKYIAGFILMAVGLVMLLKQLDLFFFPSWIFSWPMILIIIGLVKKGNNRSKNSSWLILIVVGCLFLLEQIFPGTQIVRHCWPLIIIAAGLWMVFYRKHDLGTDTFSKEAYVNPDFLNPDPAKAEPQSAANTKPDSSEDYLSSFSIFSAAKKNILSKSFKGGEVVNVFGGTDLDFSHADLNGQVVVDVMQLFGGTKLIVPPHWQVVADIAQIFGGVNDKRIPHPDVAASGKVLVLKGVSIFGGVDIKSF
jgi:predicted membrane protein